MSGGEDWVMRPATERMCLYESIKDGTLDLVDIAIMNEALEVKAENQSRIKDWVAKRGR